MAGAGCAKHRGQRPLSLVVCGCAVTPATLAPFPLAVDHTESVLAVKGSLRRFAPWTAPGRSVTSRFGASSRHFSLLQKRILSMKRHRDEHDLGERWSWTYDEFDLLRNRTDSGPITT